MFKCDEMRELKFKSQVYIQLISTTKYKLINYIVQSGTTDLKTTFHFSSTDLAEDIEIEIFCPGDRN